MYQGFPFEIRMEQRDPYEHLSEKPFYEKLAKSRETASGGKARNADEMVVDLRKKY